MNNFALNRFLANLVFASIAIKLIISPWSTGDLQVPVGQVLNYSCDGLLLLSAVLGVLCIQRRFLFLYLSFGVTGFSYALSSFFYTDLPPWQMLNFHLKIYLPLLVFPVLFTYYQLDRAAFLLAVKRLSLLVGMLLIIGLLILPSSMNRLEAWWPTYFSGLHSTAYAALMLIFLAYGLYKHGQISLVLTVSIVIALSISIYFGWGVRTATLSSLVFLLGLASIHFSYEGRLMLRYVIVAMPMMFVALIILFIFVGDVDQLASGRLSMYTEKYQQLMGNSFLQWVIGNGYGSDLIETDIWWWAAKGAHSDLITMLVEGGGVYLFVFCLVSYKLYCMGGWQLKFMLLAVFITAIISNGIFVRPIAGYLLSASLVLFLNIKDKQGRLR